MSIPFERKRLFTQLASILLGCFAIPASHADTVELSGGGHVSGEVSRVKAKISYVIVTLDADFRVALPEGNVRRVVAAADLTEYRRRAKIAGDDAELNYQLGRWCGSNSLQSQKRYHYQRTIELDPEHAQARANLGYVKEQNKWVNYSELQRSRGLINVAGRWQLPEVVAMERAEEAAEVTAKKWIKEIKTLRAAALADNGEAIAKLHAIEDPLAAIAVAQELLDSRTGKSSQPRALRQLWVKLLGRFDNLPAVKGLVQAGVEEQDDVVREAALEQLQSYGGSSAVATYLPMLKSNDNRVVNQAARALSFFPDPELAFPLVNALVTEHKTTTTIGGGTQAGFTQDGSVSSGSGSKTIVQKNYLDNPAVLSILKVIEPGVDYGFNKAKWLSHFASKRSSYTGDLRRDP